MAELIEGVWAEMSAELLKEIDALRAEVASQRRSLANHPSADALRFVAPFIRDAIAAGTWAAGPGTESVEHEVASALTWLDRIATQL